MSETTIAIANLTNQTTALLTEVTIQQGQVVAAATTQAQLAAASATTAATSATAATADANAADAARILAEAAEIAANTSALNAAAVVTGGTATVAPQAGKIPLADSEGIIDADWLPAEITGRNVFKEDQAKGSAKYAASGFVHFGKHRVGGRYVKSNQGLFSNSLAVNYLNMGQGTNGQSGESKEAYPVLNIAGIETKFKLEQNNANQGAKIKFPDAPNGTVTYDSATGVITDYTTDVDPKYGDVASTVNEAVARAFEGIQEYGDFRDGQTANLSPLGTANAIYGNVNGEYVIDGTQDTGATTIRNDYFETTSNKPQTEYLMELRFTIDVTTGPETIFNIGHNASDAEAINLLPFKGVGDHVYSETNLSGTTGSIISAYFAIPTGCKITIKSISIVEATQEVVTERVDMYGFEGFLEEVTTGNPYVYPNGLIQSQATSMDGANTSASNRPATYYAVFDGDTGSVGKGVNFNATTNANKVKMFSNPKNNLYWIEGSLYQWRVRQRTVAGVGNGDWGNLSTFSYSLGFNTKSRLTIQGFNNVTSSGKSLGSSSWAHYYGENSQVYPASHNKGVANAFSLTVADDAGIDGHCYFLVCGTVPRLNQGAFHPSFNPMGASKLTTDGSDYKTWYEYSIGTVKDTFDKARVNTGRISTASGRPDGKFYDAIYASGQGGVIDYRLSAWDKSSPEDASKVDAMLKNGSYRGVEKLIETVGFDLSLNAPTLQGNSWDYVQDGIAKPDWYTVAEGNTVTYPVGQLYQVTDGISEKGFQAAWVSTSGGQLTCRAINRQSPLTQQPVHLVFAIETNIAVSGEFTQTDVIGDPANILLNPDLKDGWMGSWIPDIPDGTSHPYTRSRKAVIAASTYQESDNDGVTWSSGSYSLDTVTNAYTSNFPVGRVFVNHQTAFAKQTKVANNEPVFNGDAGIGSVVTTKTNAITSGNLLSESLLGKVNTGNQVVNGIKHLTVNGLNIDSAGFLEDNAGNLPLHDVISITVPANSSSAVKALDYQVVHNQQLGINYAYEELVYNVDWGDTGQMAINSGQTTNTDDNGTTVLTGTNTLAIPYGWSKNNI